ncbi:MULTISPECIES: (2,3-dihydroxybenzoyl)adenylate synthase [unclassified Streptomyces]|uniref:(2,3-dihydroxybenzoyl)adenylate synthase n=1 Tax=unclassified Streptomyces TaxID=2593676 RepID=UPI000CD5BFB5|nr:MULTISPECIES: AMP-binding protein [unclassified Streptomyces]AWL41139.1 2,3-dihydroxybenzoate-AMP ligase [Streptomyces sp. SM18]
MLEGCTPWPGERARRYRAAGHWRGENLADLLSATAATHHDRTALVLGGRRLTFAELDRRVARTAAGFVERGIAAGDRVVVQLPNVPEFVIVCFALFRMGAKPVFSLVSHRANEIRHLCGISGAVAYVVPGEYQGFDHTRLALDLVEEHAALRKVFVLDREAVAGAAAAPPGVLVALDDVDAEPLPLPAPDPSDVAFFLLSGGTTALPKLIPRTHDDYAYQVRAAAALLGLDQDAVYLAVLPAEFNFTWGCPGVVGTLLSGGTVVLADAPIADECFETVAREGVTFTSLVPTLAQLWVEAAEWSEADLSSLRLVQIGGARTHSSLAARVGPVLGCRLQQVFGMAEGLLTLSRPTDSEERVLATQGRPLSPDDEVRIVGPAGDDVPPGGTGELLTRGPYTLQGYYKAPEHNARAFTEDGFYRTGDLARLTDDGDLVIEGRIKDVINRGGDKVSAPEVEEHLLAHPAVAEAAVVPVPDPFLGERIGAYVVPDGPPPALRELKEALHADGLADYKLPDWLAIVEALPLTGLGKVDKKTLTADAAARIHAADTAAPDAATVR